MSSVGPLSLGGNMSPQNRTPMNGSAGHAMSQFVQFCTNCVQILHKLCTNDTPDHLYEKYPYYKVVDIEDKKICWVGGLQVMFKDSWTGQSVKFSV